MTCYRSCPECGTNLTKPNGNDCFVCPHCGWREKNRRTFWRGWPGLLSRLSFVVSISFPLAAGSDATLKVSDDLLSGLIKDAIVGVVSLVFFFLGRTLRRFEKNQALLFKQHNELSETIHFIEGELKILSGRERPKKNPASGETG